jgi:hypothetical protein
MFGAPLLYTPAAKSGGARSPRGRAPFRFQKFLQNCRFHCFFNSTLRLLADAAGRGATGLLLFRMI